MQVSTIINAISFAGMKDAGLGTIYFGNTIDWNCGAISAVLDINPLSTMNDQGLGKVTFGNQINWLCGVSTFSFPTFGISLKYTYEQWKGVAIPIVAPGLVNFRSCQYIETLRFLLSSYRIRASIPQWFNKEAGMGFLRFALLTSVIALATAVFGTLLVYLSSYVIGGIGLFAGPRSWIFISVVWLGLSLMISLWCAPKIKWNLF